MNSYQMNKVAMFNAVYTCLTQTRDESAIVALPTKITRLRKKLDELAALATIQDRRVDTSILRRDAAFVALESAALAVGGIAHSYAQQHDLPTLAKQVRVRPSDFQGVRKVRSVQIAQQIHDAVAPMVAQLVEFGLTAEMVSDFQAKIREADEAQSTPRNYMGSRKTATAELARCIRDTDTLLVGEIDPLMLPLKRGNRDVFGKYKAARANLPRSGGRSPATVVSLPTAIPTPSVPSEALAA